MQEVRPHALRRFANGVPGDGAQLRAVQHVFWAPRLSELSETPVSSYMPTAFNAVQASQQQLAYDV